MGTSLLLFSLQTFAFLKEQEHCVNQALVLSNGPVRKEYV